MKSKYILYIVLAIGFYAKAQQQVQFTDYKLNMSSFNPAFAGYFDGSILLIHRSQFIGIDGAPEAQNLNVNIPIDQKMGMGFNAINEKLGVTQEVTLAADYSYSIYTDDYNMLTFGIKAGVNILNIDFSKLDLQDQNDQSFENNIDIKWLQK